MGDESGLARLQVAFMASVLGAVLAVLTYWQLFEHPDESVWMLATHAPSYVAASVGLPGILVGMWFWMRYGKGDLAATLRAAFVRSIASSRSMLVVGVVGFGAMAVTAGVKVATTKPVRLSVVGFAPATAVVYPDCRDQAAPSSTCGGARRVDGDGVVWVRVPRSNAHVVVETRSSERPPVFFGADVSASSTIELRPPLPAPPKVSGGKAAVLLYELHGYTPRWAPALLTKNIADAILDGYEGQDVEVVRANAEYSPELAAAWASKGLRPIVAIHGDYDDTQVRLSIVPDRATYLVRLPARKGADLVSLLLAPGLPVAVTGLDKLRVAVGASVGMTDLVERYPRRAAGITGLLTALQFLEGGRPDAALAALKSSNQADGEEGALLHALLRLVATLALEQPAEQEMARVLKLATHPAAPSGSLRLSEADVRRLLVATVVAAVTPRVERAMAGVDMMGLMRDLEHADVARRGRAMSHLYETMYGPSWPEFFDFQQAHLTDFGAVWLCSLSPDSGGGTVPVQDAGEDGALERERLVRNLSAALDAMRSVLTELPPAQLKAICRDVPLSEGRTYSLRKGMRVMASLKDVTCPGPPSAELGRKLAELFDGRCPEG